MSVLLCCTTSQTGQIRAVFCAVFSTYQQPKSHPAIGVPPLMEPPMILVAKWGTSLSSRVLFTRCYMSQKQRGEMREAYPKLRGIP